MDRFRSFFVFGDKTDVFSSEDVFPTAADLFPERVFFLLLRGLGDCVGIICPDFLEIKF